MMSDGGEVPFAVPAVCENAPQKSKAARVKWGLRWRANRRRYTTQNRNLKGHSMTTTLKALQDRMEADLRLTSMGVLSSQNTSQDAEWWGEWIKTLPEVTSLPLDVRLEQKQPPEADQT